MENTKLNDEQTRKFKNEELRLKERQFINNLVILGKKVSIEASENAELDKKIKKMSGY